MSAKAIYLNGVQLGAEPLDETGWACTLRLCDIEAEAVSSSSLSKDINLEGKSKYNFCYIGQEYRTTTDTCPH